MTLRINLSIIKIILDIIILQIKYNFVTNIDVKKYYDIIKQIIIGGKKMEHFDEACSEMDFIISNMDTGFLDKIPDKLKKFFKENKSNKYKVNLKVDKPLYEQNLLEETQIFIQIIYKLFIASKPEKEKYISECRKLFVQKNAERWMKKRENN